MMISIIMTLRLVLMLLPVVGLHYRCCMGIFHIGFGKLCMHSAAIYACTRSFVKVQFMQGTALWDGS